MREWCFGSVHNVELAFASNSKSSGAVGNEITHGIQYKNLQLSLKREGSAGALADIMDEVAAYVIQAGSELNLNSMFNPPIVNEAFVRNYAFPDRSQPYLSAAAGPINGLNANATPTPQLRALKADAIFRRMGNVPMNDYY